MALFPHESSQRQAALAAEGIKRRSSCDELRYGLFGQTRVPSIERNGVRAVYYIGADVHSNNTELAVEQNGTIVQRHSVAPTVQAIRQVLEKLDGRKHLVPHFASFATIRGRLPRSASRARNDIQCLVMSLRGAQRRSNLLPLVSGLAKCGTRVRGRAAVRLALSESGRARRFVGGVRSAAQQVDRFRWG